MIKTVHKYITKYPVKETDTSLILGTIHPHVTENFQIDFFYGNRNSIWNILGLAFPELDLSSKASITKNLLNSNIWISDMILTCERQNEKVTQDKQLQNIELNTLQIEKGIRESQIKEIFFTSGFGKNNAAKLFCDAFSIKVELDESRKFKIPEYLFNRRIKGIVLFSPSGQANIGISKSKQYLDLKEQYKRFDKPVNQFKINAYGIAFENYFTNSK